MDIAILDDKDAPMCKVAAASRRSIDEIPYDCVSAGHLKQIQ